MAFPVENVGERWKNNSWSCPAQKVHKSSVNWSSFLKTATWFLAANGFKPAFQFVFAVAQEHGMKARWEPLLFCFLMAVLPLQLHRASLSHSAEKMLLDSFGLLGYCPDDLTSFAVQAEAEDSGYIALAPRRTAQHVWADRPLHRHMLPARLNKSLNKTRSIHRTSDPGWQTSPVMVRESIRQVHLTEWVGPLQQWNTVSHISVLLPTYWCLWSQVDATLDYLWTYWHAPVLKGTEIMTYFQEQWGHKKTEWCTFIARWPFPSSWNR